MTFPGEGQVLACPDCVKKTRPANVDTNPVGKKTKVWYAGELKGIDLKKHEWSVYFPSDKETAVLNLSDPSASDFLKEGHGWRVG